MGTDLLPVNRCDQPPWVIASPRFNRHPLPLEIQGVRRAHQSFFSRLESLADPAGRQRCFRDYIDLVFQTEKWRRETTPLGRRSLRNSYLRFLRGWMLDASSAEGAVLKGWVESRFGLPPVFHAGRIEGIDSREYLLYLAERMRESARTNAVESQFDLLYEFVQYELRRRHPGVPVLHPLPGSEKPRGLPRPRGTPGKPHRAAPQQPQLLFLPARARLAVRQLRPRGGRPRRSKIFFRADLLPGVLPRARRSRW